MKLSELRALMRSLPESIPSGSMAEGREYIRALGLEPGELYQELEMESRFVDTHRDVSHSNDQVNLHSHAFYELLYCRNTCGAEYLVGAERYRLRKGDIVMIPPGISHRPLLPEHMAEPYRRDVLWISMDFAEHINQIFPGLGFNGWGQPCLLRTAGTRWEGLGELFRRGVLESEERNPGWELAVMGNTLTILTHLKRMSGEGNAARLRAEEPELLDRVMAYVEANMARKLTLAEVARHFYVSESTVSQIFRRKMGVSFYRCVTQRRLIWAKQLISQGTALESVSRQVGFSDYSSFYRAFKQEYGISPSQYHRLLENNDVM